MNITLLHIDSYRDGTCGTPFHVVLFRDGATASGVKLGVVLDAPSHVAVLDPARLLDYDGAFGADGWRGDAYEPHLRRLVAEHEAAEAAAFDGGDRV